MDTSRFAAAFAAFDRVIAEDTASDASWQALQDLSRAVIGAKLFTVTTADMSAEVARREFTSDPQAYPVSGTKPITRDAWFAIVHDEHRTFVANTIRDIAAVFPDHETIWGLGCGSVANIPVVVAGELLGTVNCLDVEHHYSPERVEAAELLRLPAKLAFLAAKRVG